MTLTMTTAAVEGVQLTVAPFRADAVVGTIGLPTLLQLVPSPKLEEDRRALKYAPGTLRRHSEIRALVQRTLKGTRKGRNVSSYAAYIAGGISGHHGRGWSTPPVTLWSPQEPGTVGEELLPGTGICRITLTAGNPVIAIDAETQVAALHELYDEPERHGLTYELLSALRVPFEMYWSLSVEEARQIFYDRNVEGVPVAKNLAMSMDQRDFATRLAHHVAEAVTIEHNGKLVPLSKLVNTRKRQLGRTDPELVTLSALRVLVVTALFGRSGLALTGTTVREGDLPGEMSADEAEYRIVPLLSALILHLREPLIARTAVSTPAVLAGLGIAVHDTADWYGPVTEKPRTGELFGLLAGVRWEREARYWDGIAASANAAGRLNFGGGAKDSGGRVADAILYPETEPGRKISGQA